MTTEYYSYITGKQLRVKDVGFKVSRESLNPHLKEFQKDAVQWSVLKGRSAIFASTGLGKTIMQLEWSKQIIDKCGGMALIFAPLGVARRTAIENEKFGFHVNLCRSQEDMKAGINIANYEILEKFDPDSIISLVLDESAILKNYMGKTKGKLIKAFCDVEYKLNCTAVPAPNDYTELLNQAHHLNVMDSSDALTHFFTNDTKEAGNLKLREHGVEKFWQWR